MILPIEYPPIETYQGSAFILGIIKAHRNLENVFYNHYINLECNDTCSIFNVNLEFSDVLWGYYRSGRLAEMNLYFIKNIARDKAFGFLKERIEQGNYLIFCGVDEYYLSYSKNYQKRHFIHDTYVYGYEETSFTVMAYQEGKLGRLKVPYREIEDALYSLEEQEEVSFCTFRPSQTARVVIDWKLIKQEYSDYFQSVSSGDSLAGTVYGINVYDVIIRCLNEIGETEGIDLRVFRCLWEHKKVMRNRAEKLQECCEVEMGGYELLDELEGTAYQVFMLMIKYSITSDRRLLRRAVRYLEDMRGVEKQWYRHIAGEPEKRN